MGIRQYFNKIYKKIEKFDKEVTNPFPSEKKSFNPFEAALTRTYVWIEKNEDEEDNEP